MTANPPCRSPALRRSLADALRNSFVYGTLYMHIRGTLLGWMLLLAASCRGSSSCVGAEAVMVRLPGEAKNIAFGGNGKYLVAYVREKQVLAVVDLEQARLVKEIPVADNKVRFASGAEALVVSLGEQNVLARYSFKTFERDLVQPIEEPVFDLCLGSASQGPIMVLVRRKPKFGGNENVRPQLFDLATLKPVASGNFDAPNDIIGSSD